MQSRFVWSPEPQRRGVLLRMGGAIFFFLGGVIASSVLYPHADANLVSPHDGLRGDARHAAAIPAPDSIPNRAVPPSRDNVERLGGPIPQAVLTAAETAVAPAPTESRSLSNQSHPTLATNVEKPDATGDKATRAKEHSRRNRTPNRLYREQPSYWAAQGTWNWNWGTQPDRRGQYTVWR